MTRVEQSSCTELQGHLSYISDDFFCIVVKIRYKYHIEKLFVEPVKIQNNVENYATWVAMAIVEYGIHRMANYSQKILPLKNKKMGESEIKYGVSNV